MIVETSAIVSMLMQEEGFELLVEKMASATSRSLSVVSYVEACMVLTRLRGENAATEFDWVLSEAQIVLVPVDARQAMLAHQGFLRYGKGRHPAKLNFGDCFAYALAKQTGEPLLYIGNDFSQTDIVAA